MHLLKLHGSQRTPCHGQLGMLKVYMSSKKELDKFIEEKFIQCIKLQLAGCEKNIQGQYHCWFVLFSQASQASSFGTAENNKTLV